MELSMIFMLNSILLGVGLAMDAFSVSMANGLSEPKMKSKKMIYIAMSFALFQGVMPLTGWVFVHFLVEYFSFISQFLPIIALALLCFIGGNMIFSGIKHEEAEHVAAIGIMAILLQGIATSIDALSVGFTIAEYSLLKAFSCATIIALVTFFICFAGLCIGKKFGDRLSDKAMIFGGAILIFIGINIYMNGLSA